MKLTLPTGLTRFVARNSLVLQKKSPTILFAAGVTGFIGTTVLASRATLKFSDVLDEVAVNKQVALGALDDDDVDYDQSDYNQDVATIYAMAAADAFKLYGPAIALGGLSIAALTSSHHILNKRNAGLTAAYAALDKGFSRYRDRVREEFGVEKDYEFYHGRQFEREVTVTDDNNTQQVVKYNGRGAELSVYSKFFDELNEHWQKVPEYNMIFLRQQQNFWNDRLRQRGHVYLNEVYQSLGIDHTKAGAVVGWVHNSEHGDNFIDFGVFNGNNPEAVDFVNGREAAIRLDFNVDGIIYDLMDS